MKATIRLIATLLSTLMVLTAMIPAASAEVPYDSFAQYGQLTFEIEASDKVVMDGVVSPGEYTTAGIVTRLGDVGTILLNWSDEKNPIPEEELIEVLPEKVTYYIAYDKEAIYLACEVVEADLYTICNVPTEMWGVDCIEFDVAVDAYDELASGTLTRTQALDRISTCVGLIDYGGTGDLIPQAINFGTSSYCDYVVHEEMESYGATRNNDTQTTTYEVKLDWDRINYEMDYVPSEVFIRFQLFLSDSRYLDNVDLAGGWVACIGGFRFACNLDEDAQAATGATGGTAPHILKLVDADELNSKGGEEATQPGNEDTTEGLTDAVTEAATDAVTDAATDAATDGVTEAVTEAGTSAITEAETAAEGGCASSVGFGLASVLVAAAACVVSKRKF